jgi:sec-independent protein translocase protein TatB
MFDIGWQELFIIAVLAIIVVGPKDLPRALKTVTGYIRKVKGLAREFQSGVDEMVREAELDDLKKEMNDATGGDLRKSLEDAVDPTGEMKKDLDMKDIERDLNRAAQDAQAERSGDSEKSLESPASDASANTIAPPEAELADDAPAKPAEKTV